MTEIKSPRLGEGYRKITHSSGLEVLLCPMEGFRSAYALFATKYGSIDTIFKTGKDADFVTVPEGIAHFLEHKLFESEDGDAFSRYAKTGASANAYTSFDRTAYLFSCTDKFDESIEILLDFVTHPYFTQQTVEKEQGIIGQEINMYLDDPEWRVFFNMLAGMYHNNPMRIDIAGTVESIAKIDADLLYRCYNTFYNLHNMVLVVAGNFEPQVVLDACDRILKTAPAFEVESIVPEEPESVFKPLVEQKLPVALPLFNIGFKHRPMSEGEAFLKSATHDILMDILIGEASPLYRRLYDQGLINATFSSGAEYGRGHAYSLFSGESREPEKVHEAIVEEIARLQREGFAPGDFESCKKSAYGRFIGMFGGVTAMARRLLSSHFAGKDAYDILEAVANVTPEELQQHLVDEFDSEKCTVSIVRSGE